MVNENGADRGGWTLVARVDGHTNDFAGISPTWTNSDLINEEEGTDLTKTSSMKNYGWGNIISNQLMSCFSGPRENCATFTHNKEMTLANLFKTQFAVETSEHYTFKSLMGKFGKTLDISELKTVTNINISYVFWKSTKPNKAMSEISRVISALALFFANAP